MSMRSFMVVLGGAVVIQASLLIPDPASATDSEAFFFDGTDDRIVVDNDDALNPAGGITIEAWVLLVNDSGCQSIVGKNFPAGYWLGLCNGRIRYYSHGGSTSMDGAGTVPQGEWTHVAVTYDDEDGRVYYINGVADFSDPTGGPMPINNFDLGIGGEATATCFDFCEFEGLISEVRLWDHARSQADIRHDMTRRIVNPRRGLLAVWPLVGGADELLGMLHGVPKADATPASAIVQPEPHEPLPLLRLDTTPTVDGSCSEYGSAVELPLWLPPGSGDGLGFTIPVSIFAGATASEIYLCLPNLPRTGSDFLSIHLDTLGDDGLAPRSDDLRFDILESDGSLQTFIGSDGGFLPWLATDTPDGVVHAIAGEFHWGIEVGIPRSELISGGNEPFALDLLYEHHDGDTTLHGWPDDFRFNNPASWEETVIDDTLPPPDSGPPDVTSTSVSPTRPDETDTISVTAHARDGRDLARIEIFVSQNVSPLLDPPIEVCVADFTGDLDFSGSCEFSDSLEPGLYHYTARATDHRGKTDAADIKSFRVTADGKPPEFLTLVHEPSDPEPGQTVTITARAFDPSGLQHISLREPFSRSIHHCVYDPPLPEDAICTLNVDPPDTLLVARYEASATDAEDFRAEAPRRTILFGNEGLDSDGDGIADHIESLGLCTSAFQFDTDRDGLPDGWEVLGVEFDDGEFTDLPWLGANPCLRDIFVQHDYERGAKPPDAAFDTAVNEYREHGIAVHFDFNERPRPQDDPVSQVGAAKATYQIDPATSQRYFAPHRNWTHFYAYTPHKTGNSGGWNRIMTIDLYSGADGHCLDGPNQGARCRSDSECPDSTCARSCLDGIFEGASCETDDDCIGSVCRDNFECPLETDSPELCGDGIGEGNGRRRNDLAYRIFHELGHITGLGHGGREGSRDVIFEGDGFFYLDNEWVSTNYKPNHRSAMSYLYGTRGPACMEPPDTGDDRPNWKASLTYAKGLLPSLDETDLNEFSTSAFSRALRALDCPDSASEDARPVVEYTCEDPDEPQADGDDPPRRYRMVSDGLQTLARRPKGGTWDMDPPAHDPGIDWNCDGDIEGSVRAPINGSGNPGGGMMEDNWNDNESFPAMDEWSNIPNLPRCHMIYSSSNACYLQPEDYRDAIPGLATGVPPQDCRPDSPFYPEDTCDGVGLVPLADNAHTTTEAARLAGTRVADNPLPARASGHSTDEHTDDEPEPSPSATEVCDGVDDDGDGHIDEGCPDIDADSVNDALDNCPATPNPDQADRNEDFLGDACQTPGIVDLRATVQPDDSVVLNWSVTSPDHRGFVIHRVNPDDSVQVMGSTYPTTIEQTFADDPGSAQDFRYVVRAVNLHGTEGPAETILFNSVVLFRDRFEALP